LAKKHVNEQMDGIRKQRDQAIEEEHKLQLGVREADHDVVEGVLRGDSLAYHEEHCADGQHRVGREH